MLSVVEKYVTQIKENRKRLDEGGVNNASVTIFSIALYGSALSEGGKGNVAKKQFNENNNFNRLVDVCKFFVSQHPSSPEQKHITVYFSLAACRLLKSERLPLSFGPILAYVYKLKSSPPLPNGVDISSAAQSAWREIERAEEFMN
jgi:hypothetical protein